MHSTPPCRLLTWSGGGPCGYRLAVRHPQWVRGLVAVSAVSRPYVPEHEARVGNLVMHTTMGNSMLQVMAEHALRARVMRALKADGTLREPRVSAVVHEIMNDLWEGEVGPRNARRFRAADEEGVANDLACFAAIDSLELERIAIPALIVAADAEGEVPPGHSDHAIRVIPGAEHLVVSGGRHLCLHIHSGQRAAQARVIEHFQV